MNLNFSIIPNAEAPLPPNPTIYPPCQTAGGPPAVPAARARPGLDQPARML